jgi:hypothetical protein
VLDWLLLQSVLEEAVGGTRELLFLWEVRLRFQKNSFLFLDNLHKETPPLLGFGFPNRDPLPLLIKSPCRTGG